MSYTELLSWWNDNNSTTVSREKSDQEDDDLRTEYSDYLTDKYLCLKLDPLKSSELVSKVRKVMSKIIEDFASKSCLPDDIDDIVFYKITGNIDDKHKNKNSSLVLNMNKKIQENKVDYKKHNDFENNKNQLRHVVDKRETTEIIGKNGENVDRKTKQDVEKKTMKEQYAEYMRRTKGHKNKKVSKPIVEIDDNDNDTFSDNGSSTVSKITTPGNTVLGNTEDISNADEYEVLNSDIRSLLSSIQKPISSSNISSNIGKLK